MQKKKNTEKLTTKTRSKSKPNRASHSITVEKKVSLKINHAKF